MNWRARTFKHFQNTRQLYLLQFQKLVFTYHLDKNQGTFSLNRIKNDGHSLNLNLNRRRSLSLSRSVSPNLKFRLQLQLILDLISQLLDVEAADRILTYIRTSLTFTREIESGIGNIDHHYFQTRHNIRLEQSSSQISIENVEHKYRADNYILITNVSNFLLSLVSSTDKFPSSLFSSQLLSVLVAKKRVEAIDLRTYMTDTCYLLSDHLFRFLWQWEERWRIRFSGSLRKR